MNQRLKFLRRIAVRVNTLVDTQCCAAESYYSDLPLTRFVAIREQVQNAKLELKKSKRKNYYKILQVEKTATEVEIKKGSVG